jgi:hypothetical protein
MEASFGREFGDVRVHSDAKAAESAEAVNALAYTAGNHIAFATGRYTSHTPAGHRLLAHELVHVVQQRSSEQIGSDAHVSLMQRQPQEPETFSEEDWRRARELMKGKSGGVGSSLDHDSSPIRTGGFRKTRSRH